MANLGRKPEGRPLKRLRGPPGKEETLGPKGWKGNTQFQGMVNFPGP